MSADRPELPADPLDDHARSDRLELLRPVVVVPWVDRARAALAARGLVPARLFGAGVVAIVVLGIGWWLLRPPPPPVESTLPIETAGRSTAGGASASGPADPGPTSTTTSLAAHLVVHAAGAVARPGLYVLGPGARVADVVDAAGGLAPVADGDRINLAAQVTDGERVYVLRRGEPAVPAAAEGAAPPGSGPTGGGGPAAGIPAGPVDLNTATLAELDLLPGVGPSTAQAIVDHRNEHGPFASVDDLLDVRGIGDAKLAALRSRVTV